MNWLRKILKLFTGTIERPSPSDIVPRSSIAHDANIISIDLGVLNIPFTKPPTVWIPSIPDTNSMDPVFDYGHNNILIAGVDEIEQAILCAFIKKGDIIVYTMPGKNPVIHRVVAINSDAEGRWFTLRGDNNASNDPHKVRDVNIKWLYIGTIC